MLVWKLNPKLKESEKCFLRRANKDQLSVKNQNRNRTF